MFAQISVSSCWVNRRVSEPHCRSGGAEGNHLIPSRATQITELIYHCLTVWSTSASWRSRPQTRSDKWTSSGRMLCSWRTGSRTWFQTGSDGTPDKRKEFCYRDGFLARDLARLSGKGFCFNACLIQRNETAVGDCVWGLSHTMLSSLIYIKNQRDATWQYVY
jgi:hypothetical protein